jgi:tetratricopeptide (TPR) repeat protein
MNDSLANYSKAFELEPTWVTLGNLNDEYGQALIKSGNISKAIEVFKLGMDKPEIRMRGLRSLALLDMYQGKYSGAKGRLQEAILVCKARRELLSEARNHLYLSMVLGGQGDAAGRLKELDQGMQCLRKLVTQIWLSSRFGVEYVRSGAVGKASGILEIIRKEADLKNPTQSSDLHRLAGEIEIARGNYPRGIELLLLADRENHTPFSAESLAHTYLAAGNTDQAMAWYAMLIEMRDHSLGWEPQQSWITSHYDLARIYASRGKKAEAIKLLGVFLGLWKDADPHIPVLVSAKAEYSRLQ